MLECIYGACETYKRLGNPSRVEHTYQCLLACGSFQPTGKMLYWSEKRLREALKILKKKNLDRFGKTPDSLDRNLTGLERFLRAWEELDRFGKTVKGLGRNLTGLERLLRALKET